MEAFRSLVESNKGLGENTGDKSYQWNLGEIDPRELVSVDGDAGHDKREMGEKTQRWLVQLVKTGPSRIGKNSGRKAVMLIFLSL